MKINKIFVVFLSLVILLSSIIQTSRNPKIKILKALSIFNLSGTVLYYTDTHGGFHNDGTTYIELNFPDNLYLEAIKQSSKWHPLPLNKELATLVYGKSDENISIGSFLTNEDGKLLFPPIENGYYYFKDRNSESVDNQDSSKILKRNSFNFTIAIYNEDTKMLYFCELDT